MLVALALMGMALPTQLSDLPRAAAPASVSPARPALYSVRDGDTTIYIFGTFHVLDPSIRWFGGPIEEAFGSAEELVVETLPPALAAAPERAQSAAVEEARPAASFLSSSQAAVHAGQDKGMSLEHGADMVLLRSAAERGKEIEPLETLQSQYVMLSRLPGDAPETAAAGAPDAPPPSPSDPRGAELARTMTRLQSAWAAGDQGVFAAMVTGLRETSPTVYRAMFVERNARWSDWIAARMRQPGTVFVAVGAGHLSGPDSLLVRLAQRGYVSRRVAVDH